MTMPKKGRRQIVIDDKIYFYIIKERVIGSLINEM